VPPTEDSLVRFEDWLLRVGWDFRERSGTMRQKFSSQADPLVLDALRDIAREEGRHFQAVLEEALREYLERRQGEPPREEVLAHFRSSVEKNRQLGKLLAQ
jgi:hypothetical protein